MTSGEHEFTVQLRELIEQQQVVVVVGAGVSMSTTRESPTWRGLIESAIDHCRTVGASERWARPIVEQLDFASDDEMDQEDIADGLLSAAETVHRKLRQTGELAVWLRKQFADLRPSATALIEALNRLGTPILTTNYDHLIQDVTGLPWVTWRDSRKAARVVRNEERLVLHLHGHWDEPESVVLGMRSYDQVLGDKYIQAAMKAFGMTKSLLFVGCGDEGLADPNFGSFLTWLKQLETEGGVEHRHYRLVRNSEKVAPFGRLFPLPYGGDYDELPGFLASLVPKSAPATPRVTPETPVTAQELPPSVTAYRQRLAGETSRLKLLGMGKSFQIELPISDAYVPLQTTLARSLEQHDTERFRENHAAFERKVELADVFRETARLDEQGAVLLGEPGAGKTTGARQLAWQLASGTTAGEVLGLPAGITPVLLRCRNLSQAALAEDNGLRSFLADETRNAAAPDGRGEPVDALWNGEGGPLLWILDGLDEVIDPQARRQVSGWVQEALEGRPDDWFLVTCRFAGYFLREGVALGPRFVRFDVRPLNDEQVARFVHDWFATAYRKLDHPPELAAERANMLLGVLARPAYQTGHMRELATNPLLLTILCIVFHDEQALPTNRAELFQHCVSVLLQHWRREVYESDSGGGVEPFDAEAAHSVLARVAWWMHGEQDRTAAPIEDVAAEAERGLAEVAASSGLGDDGMAFVERMRDETGVLASEGEGRCGFLHLSFQEYLAAQYAAKEDEAAFLAARASDSWWREIALLSLRLSRPYCEAFFRAMLADGVAEQQPETVERCLAETRYFTAAPFLAALDDEPSPERVTAVLRLLRDRTDTIPELANCAQRFVDASEPETRSICREILARLGVTPDATLPVGTPDVIVDERTGMPFVRIQAGKFQMGSDKAHNAAPIHDVRITRDFWLAKHPVTNDQYRRFLSETKYREPSYWGDRRFNQPDQPVVAVNWHDAQAYCHWAGFRLPTEAEWEYACRAGTTTDYSFGDKAEQLDDYGWYSGNSGGQTQPVCTKQPNAWDLYDMHGNVWEWCQDWYGESSAEIQTDPAGPDSGTGRVLRGGSWDYLPGLCRSAVRNQDLPGYRFVNDGFRVART